MTSHSFKYNFLSLVLPPCPLTRSITLSSHSFYHRANSLYLPPYPLASYNSTYSFYRHVNSLILPLCHLTLSNATFTQLFYHDFPVNLLPFPFSPNELTHAATFVISFLFPRLTSYYRYVSGDFRLSIGDRLICKFDTGGC